MPRIDQLFTRSEWCVGVVVGAVLVLLTGYMSLTWQHSVETEEVNNTAANHIEHIYRNISELTGAISSLSTLYTVTSEDELDLYTEDLVQSSESIVSISRFDRIKESDLPAFNELMTERGIYKFEVKNIASDGSLFKASPQSEYNALVNVNPFLPDSAQLIGVDLSMISAMAGNIIESAIANEVILSEYPEGWPRTGDVLLMLPTFSGRYVPTTLESRLRQYDGGFLVELSMDNYQTFTDNLSTRIIAPSFLFNNEPTDTDRIMSGLFSGYASHLSPKVGLSNIDISVRSSGGVSLDAVIQAFIWMLGCVVLLLLTAGLIANNRFARKSLDSERKIALTTLETISDSVFTIGKDGAISYVNPAAESMLNRDASDLIGSSIRQSIAFVDDETCTAGLSDIESQLNGGTAVQLTKMELQGNDATTQVDCAFTPFDEQDDVNGGVLVMRDVGKERALTRKLEHLATHDSLTGLVNRYYFEMQLESLVEGAHERGESHAVCYIDLDQFKVVNDTVGHSAGDSLLIQVAERIKYNCREGDILARLGGDEFGLLIKHASPDAAEKIAKRLHEFFQTFYFKFEQHSFAIRASIGHVDICSEYTDVSEVLAAADIACYSAKDMGRNSLHIFRPECRETSERQGEMALLPKLQNALAVDKFVLFVQPIAKILPNGTHNTSKYEILLRMEDDDGTLITPFRLISAAERYDLMTDIDRWVINRALHDIAELQSLYGDELPTFSINISGQSAVDGELGKYLQQKLQQTGVAANKICIEITETSAMGDLSRAQQLLEFLHELGCKVALDDFGAGECSFGYLKNLPVDYLKIDGQFVKDLDTCSVHQEMLRFAQRVANLLNITTVAEFVENESILNCLREMGIDYAQGYHISKPFHISNLKGMAQEQQKAA